MRSIELEDTDEGRRVYTQLNIALRNEESPVKGIETIRRVGALLDAMESIGTRETLEGGRERWTLASGGGKLCLEEAEYEELKSRFAAVNWIASAARHVMYTHDLLEKAVKEKKIVDADKPAGDKPALRSS